MLMGIIDAPEISTERHINSHSLALVKISAMKSASNIFEVSS